MIRRRCLQLLPLAGTARAAEPPMRENLEYGPGLQFDLALPATPGPSPVLVCLHGGGWSMGSRRSFHRTMPGFTAQGYAAAAIQYRLAPAHKFPAQLDDVRRATRYLRTHAARLGLDPRRVVLMGASAGAHLALLAAFAAVGTADAVQAVIDLSGPTDLRDWRMLGTAEANLVKTVGKTSANLLEDLLGGPPLDDEALRRASPVLQVRESSPPVLVLHWKDDQAVEAGQARRLVEALAAKGVPHETVWFEGRGHAFAGRGVEEIVPRSVAFLKTHLR